MRHRKGFALLVAACGLFVSAASFSWHASAVSNGSFVPLKPFRILDTRSGLCGGNTCGSVGPGQTLTLQVSGYTDPVTSQSVPSGASAVVLNTVAVNDTAPSFLTVFPAGSSQPLASNLNFDAGTVVANLVTVPLGTGGQDKIFNQQGTLDIVADVEGYFTPRVSTDPHGEFHPMPPLRVCDTRAGMPSNTCNGLGAGGDHLLAGGQVIKVPVTGQPAYCSPNCPATIPNDGTAEVAVLNLTAVAGTADTFLSIFPDTVNGCPYGGSKPPPPFSTINVGAGRVQANRVMVLLGPGASPNNVCVFSSQGNINFVLDANGWFGDSNAATSLQFVPATPARVCDTRSGQGTPCAGHSLTSSGTLTVAIAGQGPVPTGAKALIANVTAVSGTQPTFFTVFPSDVAQPNASDVNVTPGQNLPNLVVVQLSAGGSPGNVNIFNKAGTIDAVVDVQGWFL